MNILDLDKKYLIPAIENAYLNYLTDKYNAEGYSVKKHFEFKNGLFADILIEKESSRKIIELKFFYNQFHKNEKIIKLKKYLEEIMDKIELEIVFIEIPTNKIIQFDSIESMVFNYLINEELDSDLDILSTHSRIEDVSYIDILKIDIAEGIISIEGEGNLDLELQWGSDGDQDRDMGHVSSDSINFTFDATLDNKHNIIEFSAEYDTSDYNQ